LPAVASIPAIVGVPLVPDVLTFYGLPAFAGVPVIVGVSAVAFNPSVAGVPALVGVLAVVSLPADPCVPTLLLLVSLPYLLYCSVKHIRLSDYRSIGLRLSDCHFFCSQTIGISNIGVVNSRNYRNIGYGIKTSIYRTIGNQTKKNSVAQLWTASFLLHAVQGEEE
jgi:hypothetical protein